MKKSCLPLPGALLGICLLVPSITCAERLPGLVMDDTEYQTRKETGPDIMPVTATHSAAELKMSSQLASLTNAALRAPGMTVAQVKAEMMRLGQIRSVSGQSDQFHVYVHAVNAAALEGIRPLLSDRTEADPQSEWPLGEWPMIAGWVQETDLPVLALKSDVVFVQAVDPPRFRTGSVTSEGDALHHGPQARTVPLSLDGGGISVGVISNGVTTLATAQSSNDLPALINLLNSGTGDEGTAMLEIVHDIAPAAALAFCGAGSNKIAFGNAIAALHAQGCNVICDDVGWYDDPFFEHSPLGMQIGGLQTMRDYLHVSAAGNDAQLHHQQVFTDIYPALTGDGWHDPFLIVSIPNNGVVDVFMQWSEALAGMPASDYDLYLADYYNPTVLLAVAATRNRVGETIYYTNTTGSALTAAIYVYRYSGTTNHDIEIFMEPGNGSLQYTNSTSPVDAIFGHPGFGSVLATVATAAANPAAIEWDSSQGPFSLITSQVSKPNMAAADGVTITGAGGFPTPFYGTSAAAPHVAGVIALAWNRSPGIPAAAMRNPASLPQFCTDLGTFGFDFVFGWGRPLADQWALALNRPPAIAVPTGTLQCTQMQPENITSLSVSDPDATNNPLVMRLTSSHGIIQINPTIPGGVNPGQITTNGPRDVTVTADQTAIQMTLSANGGLIYQPDPVPSPPGTPVADTLNILMNDQGYSGVGGTLSALASLNLLVHEYAYEAWRHDQFDATQLADPSVSGDTADPDGDLYENRWEFFIGGDPLAMDGETSPATSISSGNMVMTFRVAKDIPASAYAIKESQDLVNWNDVPSGQITTPWPQHPTVPYAWQMQVTCPLSSYGANFLRLEFTPRY